MVQKLELFFQKQSHKKAIIGVSGGLDSSVVSVLAMKALGRKNVCLYFLPSKYTSELTRECLRQFSKKFDISIQEETSVVDGISDIVIQSLKKIYFEKGQILDCTEQNIQARARMIWLMCISNQTGALLLNCANRSEILTGYCTLYGDTAGAVSPIAHLYKTEVYKLGEILSLPKIILERHPTAELKSGQKDSNYLPEYEVLDKLLQKINFVGINDLRTQDNAGDLQAVLNLVENNAFKLKQLPPALIP